MNKNKMTVARKFALTGALLMGLTVVLATVTLIGLGSLHKNVVSLADDSLAGLSAISKVESELLELRGDYLKHLVLDTPGAREAVERKIETYKQRIVQEMAQYEKTIVTAEDRALFNKITPALNRYYQIWDLIMPGSRVGKGPEAYQKQQVVINEAFLATKDVVQALTAYNRRTGEENRVTAEAAASRVRWLTWLVLAAALLSGTVCLYVIVRSVNRALLRAVNELNSGAEQVSSASEQVSSSSQSLAQGASEQAASLEETSASTEEINSMAQRNTENSRKSAELVAASEGKMVETNRLLAGMVSAMDAINVSSGKISKIIKVIDEIAFQTNILALNAAVEAARAGEAGMGFAVVADEVRNLAQRSAQAAKDTADLIEESISRSHEGKTKVDQVAVAMESIASDAGKVKVLVEEVSLSSQEQAQGISQIAKAVSQMQQVTQRNAANAEESASAAEEMNAQAATVKDIVSDLGALVKTESVRRSTPAARAAGTPGGLQALGRAVAEKTHSPKSENFVEF